MITANVQLGRKVGQVIRVNEIQSEKLKTFSTILQFTRKVKGEFGVAVATEAYFGIALTETKPNLKAGESVNVEVIKYITSTNPATGQEGMQAHCLLLSRAEAPVIAGIAEPRAAAVNQ
jgi:hypothetical protein